VADPRRGDIYWVDFSPTIGSEQSGRRPAVVVSNDIANRHASVVTVVPVTRTIPSKPYPHTVPLAAGEPLPYAGSILCAQVRTISKERLLDCTGVLSDDQIASVDTALKIALGLH
jgi:mRNA interferase MazF